MIEATEKSGGKKCVREHLFWLMESIPVDITSPTIRELEYTFTRGSAYWPFTLNTARNH